MPSKYWSNHVWGKMILQLEYPAYVLHSRTLYTSRGSNGASHSPTNIVHVPHSNQRCLYMKDTKKTVYGTVYCFKHNHVVQHLFLVTHYWIECFLRTLRWWRPTPLYFIPAGSSGKHALIFDIPQQPSTTTLHRTAFLCRGIWLFACSITCLAIFSRT